MTARQGLLTCASTSGGAFPNGRPDFISDPAGQWLCCRPCLRLQRRGPSPIFTGFQLRGLHGAAARVIFLNFYVKLGWLKVKIK